MRQGCRPPQLDSGGRFRLRITAAVALVVSTIAFPSGTLASRHRMPGTGLRTIVIAKAPPDFSYDDGGTATHLAALIGRPVVLHFWATWCEPCRAELPAFARLRETYGAAVAFLTISDEPPGQARAFLQAHQFDLPVVEDPERKIFDAYSVTPIPVTLVLRSDGTVSYVSIGETSYDELQAAVSAALTIRE